MTYEKRQRKISQFTTDDAVTNDSLFDFVKNGINKKTPWSNLLDKIADVYGMSARVFDTQSAMVASDIRIGEMAIVKGNRYALYLIGSLSAGRGDVTLTSGFVATQKGKLQPNEFETYAEIDTLDSSILMENEACTVVATPSTAGIRGDGTFIYSVAHGLTSNDGTIIVIDADWYFSRSFSGPAELDWFEPAGDGATNDTSKFTAAAVVSSVVLVSESEGGYVSSGASVGTTAFVFLGDLATELVGTDTAADLNAIGHKDGSIYGYAHSPELRDAGIEIISGTIRQQQFRAVTSFTRSGTVGTVTMPSHGYDVGDYVSFTGWLTTGYNGSFLVATVPDADTFTVAIVNDLTVQQDSGTADGTSAGKLVDSTQNFSSTIRVGAMVVNTTDGTVTNVSVVDSNTQLTLRDDIFVSGEAYTVGQPAHPTTALYNGDTGTTSGTEADKLVDSTQNFLTTVTAGMYVINTTDDTYAKVSAVDSNTVLSLDTDIFVSGESYIVTSAGCLSSGKWTYIKDSTHEPLGVNDAVTVNPSGTGIGLTVSFNKTFSKVLTFTCTPDEQISAASGMVIGASVSLSAVEIRGSIDKTIAGRLQYDATSGWLISMGNDQGSIYIENAPSPIENVYYSSGNLYISHSYCPGQNTSVTWNTLNGTTFTYLPAIKTVTDSYTIVNFIRINAGAFDLYTGAVQAGMCLQFTKNYSGTMYFDGRDRSGEIGNGFGNIWFFGIMQV